MKTRVIILLAISAVITLSFTVVSVSHSKENDTKNSVQISSKEPLGGLVSEEKL
jgi:hypothetical protein